MNKKQKAKVVPQGLKGFRDFLPEEMVTRQKVIDTLRKVFESYGFEPLETPALEYTSTLLGKYGEEADKLIYQFKDRGGREVGLRYDLTVPLARVIASNPKLPRPFKRYQIQPVWRAEKPQAGRFREFIQCDADVVGSNSPLVDAEIIMLAVKSLEKLGLKDVKILVNDRRVFFNTLPELEVIRNTPKAKRLDIIKYTIKVLDKIDKIGKSGVLKELSKKGFSQKQADETLKEVQNAKKTNSLEKIFNYLEKLGLSDSRIAFSPTLARGLDYYTGMIFEVQISSYGGGSVAGGGRYDTLVGFSAMKYLPAVGFSFGIDRLVEAMNQQGLFKNTSKSSAKVLVSIFSPEYLEKSIEIATLLRSINTINTELYLDPEAKLNKQLKYADKKGIPYVVILGPEEIREKTVTIKDMKTGKQKNVPQAKLLEELS